MAIKFPNRTGQAGVFYTGSPNYVDVDNTGAALAGMVTFATKAADESQPGGVWADNDVVGVLVYKDVSAWQVWTALWDATNEYLEVITLEDSAGTISDTDAVDVTGVLTAEIMNKTVLSPQIVTVSGTTHTTSSYENGCVFRCTNGSATTITLNDSEAVGFHGVIVQEGAGQVSVARDGTDTVNGGTTAIDLAGQFKSAYFYQPTEGAWVVIV